MIRLDLHVHSKYSFDSLMDARTIVKVANEKNLNGLAITDHNTIRGGKQVSKQNKSQLLVIVGSEIATDVGDLIGLFLTKEIESRDSLEVLDEIRLQGGVSVFPHPSRGHNLKNAKTIEVLKIIDCIEVFSSRSPIKADEKEFLELFNRVRVAGSDAHFPQEIGLCQTIVDTDIACLDEVRKSILSGKTVLIGTYGPHYFQTMSQIVKNLKFRKIVPLVPQAFSLVRELISTGMK